jgi:cobalt-zinc-cadmium efflux system outer membrane protein
MRIQLRRILIIGALLSAIIQPVPAMEGEMGLPGKLSLTQLVEIATETNPQVRAARARWYATLHQVKQNYAPADPVFGYTNLDSPTNGFSQASVHTLTVSQSLQFPGKALLQAKTARNLAEVAHLVLQAVVRDVRAQTESAYYQLLLDTDVATVQAERVEDLKQVTKVAQVAYTANQVTQSDFITSEFDLAAARQSETQARTGMLNDLTSLNQLLFRQPDEPLAVAPRLELKPLSMPLDRLIELATRLRQEILETALSQRNARTAVELAKLEYAPDYTLGYTFDNYLLSSAAPSPKGRMQDHGLSITFNVPLFFWLKQSEGVKRAEFDLQAASYDLGSIRNQTAATVTVLYRNAQLAYQTALLYQETLTPLARQNFQVGLVSYEAGKIDFTTLAGIFQRSYDSRLAYLQAANQFLASRVALEQAIGEPLPQ